MERQHKHPAQLSNLPPPPPGRTGWPWTEAGPPLPATLPHGRPWPRVSIVTPSYNQGQFIEETIRSVLLQGYPDLEYVIIDGGSTDGSVETIQKYAPWLAYWVSEPDRGQTHAINKGFQRSTGEILAWLNSDDVYLPGTLALVGETLASAPDVYVLYGDSHFIDAAGRQLWTQRPGPVSAKRLLCTGNVLAQPAVFFRTTVLKEAGYLDETLELAMDFDFWIRLAGRYRFTYLAQPLACYRWYDTSKSGARGFAAWRELLRVVRRHGGGWTPPLALAYARFLLTHWRRRLASGLRTALTGG